MPRKYRSRAPKPPKYRLHKPSGRGVIQYRPIYGKNPHYLPGEYNSDESIAAYNEACAKINQHRASKQPAVPVPRGIDSTVAALLVAFIRWAREYYGQKSKKEFGHFRRATRYLEADEYADILCRDFGPRTLKKVREQMIDELKKRKTGMFVLNASGQPIQRNSRRYINAQIIRIRRIFLWGAEEEFCERTVADNLKIAGLRKGKTLAREKPLVERVEWSIAQQTLPYLCPMIKAMVEILYLTGMRSDELTGLQTGELKEESGVWLYEPAEHKNAWRGKMKLICIGPRARGLLAPYLNCRSDEYVFRPGIADAERRAARRAARKTPVYGKAKIPRPPRRLRIRYTADSFDHALLHAFKKAARNGVALPHWHPHQLRHTRATITREAYGREGAEALLGNTREAAEVYAATPVALAMRIARETG